MTRDTITTRIREEIAASFDVPPDRITEPADLFDLGLDSLDFVELVMWAEDAFRIDIDDDEAERIKTFGQLVELVAGKVATDDAAEECIACEKPFAEGDRYYHDVSGGFIHAGCCGPEPESYVGAEGEPLKPGDPIPEPAVWSDEPQLAEVS